MISLNILVVDDHKFQAHLLSTQLKKIGNYNITCIYSGVDALTLVKNMEFDLVFCDLNMPGMDGVELILSLNENNYDKGVIILSALDKDILSTVSNMCKKLDFSFVEYLKKPLTIQELSLVIFDLLESNRKCDELLNVISVELDDVILAFNSGDLINYYQPQVDFITGCIVSVEILARWNHPKYGVVSPIDFLPIIEANSLEDKLFNTVFYNALRDYASGNLKYKVSINITHGSLERSDFTQHFFEQCMKYNVNPNMFTIELTENEAFSDSVILLENLSRLRIKGVGISIDDFGTGYSSLMKLSVLPFTEMKVDRSFINGCLSCSTKRSIIDFFCLLSKKMNIVIVAEGVEDKDTWEFLKKLGFNLCQGFYTGKPVPIEFLIENDKFNGKEK